MSPPDCRVCSDTVSTHPHPQRHTATQSERAVQSSPHPPKCGACQRRCGRDPKGQKQGAKAAFVSRGTTVLLSATENHFSQWLGTSNVNNLFLKTQTSSYTQRYQAAHLLNPTPPGHT